VFVAVGVGGTGDAVGGTGVGVGGPGDPVAATVGSRTRKLVVALASRADARRTWSSAR
jgi:hypothetical protein